MRAPCQSQANAQWPLSVPTGCSINLGPRDPRTVKRETGQDLPSSSHDVHVVDIAQPRPDPTYHVDADKMESLLKHLKTDEFAGTVDLKYHAEKL
jgi:hypothetical protein